MATVRYTTINGRITAEKRAGVRKTYVPDPLGSTVALLNSSQQKTDTFSYWPFGEEVNPTGLSTTPFRFSGAFGFRSEPSARTEWHANVLLRALRRQAQPVPTWAVTVSMLRPWPNQYSYAPFQPNPVAIRPQFMAILAAKSSGKRSCQDDFDDLQKKLKDPFKGGIPCEPKKICDALNDFLVNTVIIKRCQLPLMSKGLCCAVRWLDSLSCPYPPPNKKVSNLYTQVEGLRLACANAAPSPPPWKTNSDCTQPN